MTAPSSPEDLLVSLIGEHAALLLIELHGGTRIVVAVSAHNKLAAEIGAEAAARLFAHFGADRIHVPLAKPWRARIYRQRGMSYAAIARKLGCNEATVWKHLHPAPAGAQMVLALPGKG